MSYAYKLTVMFFELTNLLVTFQAIINNIRLEDDRLYLFSFPFLSQNELLTCL